MLIKQVLVIMLGGALGALLRWRLSTLNFVESFPLGTLSANLAGCFALGVVLGTTRPGSLAHLFWVAGLCGALTTFSTFMHELIEAKTWGLALGYLGISLTAGAIALIGGLKFGRLF
jgi:CrcB protein